MFLALPVVTKSNVNNTQAVVLARVMNMIRGAKRMFQKNGKGIFVLLLGMLMAA